MAFKLRELTGRGLRAHNLERMVTSWLKSSSMQHQYIVSVIALLPFSLFGSNWINSNIIERVVRDGRPAMSSFGQYVQLVGRSFMTLDTQ